MERVVMTRKTSTKELEQKLKQALEELRSSKDLCKNLLQEREDSEEEIRNIVRRNTDLKGQLAELHTNYLDIVAQRDQLRNLVTAFDQCSNVHERALDRISDLESDLIQARKSILDFETCKLNIESQHTHSLYEELVKCNSQQTTQSDPINNNAVIIDLTKDESSNMHPIYFSSHNKLKKYIKVNKFIKRCNKVINNKFSQNNCSAEKSFTMKSFYLLSQNHQWRKEDKVVVFVHDFTLLSTLFLLFPVPFLSRLILFQIETRKRVVPVSCLMCK